MTPATTAPKTPIQHPPNLLPAELPNTSCAVPVPLGLGLVIVSVKDGNVVAAPGSPPVMVVPEIGIGSVIVVELRIGGVVGVGGVGVGGVGVGEVGVGEISAGSVECVGAVTVDEGGSEVLLPGPAEMAVIAKLGEVFPESPITVKDWLFSVR